MSKVKELSVFVSQTTRENSLPVFQFFEAKREEVENISFGFFCFFSEFFGSGCLFFIYKGVVPIGIALGW